ncbi:hypothetical protein [Tropicibacter oceani]|uniref:Uncharacterized protein n=1 Tax=Tropicibacter oceani TaxID=3058420 RepID=A0ABY8QH29_9RHOB|nr:hypothetical protein [Tropicibacter oceani]WGW03291.1 hypothetical protein QF118_15360 [Tropicibacter oceani]
MIRRTGLLAAAALAALTPLNLSAATQDAKSFQARLDETAAPAGEAKATVACAGLAAALRIAAPDGSNAKQTFRTLEEELVFYAMMTRRDAADEDQQTALAFTEPHVRNISAIYLERFAKNKETSGALLDNAVRANFAFCNAMRDEMKAALEQN